ncbi:hypothetical protein pb186bvf_012721 [Paramecium bursaria]
MRKLKDIESLAQGQAGALASVVSTLLLYPLENIKTRMHGQTQENQHMRVRDVIIQVFQQEGVQGFYKGLTSLAIGNYISYGLYFYWYEYFKHIFKTDISQTFQVIKPSLCSSILTSIATNPFWVIQSQQTFSKDGLNFFHKTYSIVQNQGFQALFRGLQASLILTINPIIQFVLYEYLKRKFKYQENQAIVFFLAGAVSKAVATFVTYVFILYEIQKPYQIIRTRCHLSDKHKSYLIIFRELIKEEGLVGLFKGLSPKLVQSILNSGFLLMFQEQIYEIIKNMQKKKLKKLQKIQK